MYILKLIILTTFGSLSYLFTQNNYLLKDSIFKDQISMTIKQLKNHSNNLDRDIHSPVFICANNGNDGSSSAGNTNRTPTIREEAERLERQRNRDMWIQQQRDEDARTGRTPEAEGKTDDNMERIPQANVAPPPPPPAPPNNPQ